MFEKQGQKAGANSHQYQISGDQYIIQAGVTEDRAREIATEVTRSALAEYSNEATEIGSQRISHFDEILVGEMSKRDLLQAFADPAFQVALKKAQIGAASTERESDYDLLANLLADRAERGGVRNVRAGLDRAVQIVDQIDDSALVGLTVLYAFQQFSPNHPHVHEGLGSIDRLAQSLMTSPLPTGPDWLDHLDVLGAVRLSPAQSMRAFGDYYGKTHVPGYVAPGLDPTSEEFAEAQARLQGVNVQVDFVDHELRPGFMRFPVASMAVLRHAIQSRGEDDIAVVLEVAKSFGVDAPSEELVAAPLATAIDAQPHLKVVREWWGSIDTGVQITSVGKVLAKANAKRCDSAGLLPDLD